MSLHTMFFGDRFCVSRKDGTGGGGWVYPKGAINMATTGLSFGNTLVGSGWATSVLCTNRLRKQSSHLVWTSFWQGSCFLSLNEWLPAESYDYCKLCFTLEFLP